jgi:hypothetical protein
MHICRRKSSTEYILKIILITHDIALVESFDACADINFLLFQVLCSSLSHVLQIIHGFCSVCCVVDLCSVRQHWISLSGILLGQSSATGSPHNILLIHIPLQLYTHLEFHTIFISFYCLYILIYKTFYFYN